MNTFLSHLYFSKEFKNQIEQRVKKQYFSILCR